MYPPSRTSTPKAPKLRNIDLPPASPALTPQKNSPYSTPRIVANLKISTVSSSLYHQTAPHNPSLSQMPQYTPTNDVSPTSKRPLKSILKNPWQGIQSTPSNTSTSSTSSSSSQKRPLKGILKNSRSEKKQGDLPNLTANLSAQSSIPAAAPHEVRPSDVGPPGYDSLGTITSKGGLKPGQISLDWILIHQDKDRKRPEQFIHLQKGFDMGVRPDNGGAWVYDTYRKAYVNPTHFVEQSASTHSTLRYSHLHIVAAWNPRWECTVQPSNNGIQCIDIFRAIFDMLQTPLTPEEHRTANLSALERARVERVRKGPHSSHRSTREYLRIDLLGQYRHFKGLTQNGLDWVLDVFGPNDYPYNGVHRPGK